MKRAHLIQSFTYMRGLLGAKTVLGNSHMSRQSQKPSVTEAYLGGFDLTMPCHHKKLTRTVSK